MPQQTAQNHGLLSRATLHCCTLPLQHSTTSGGVNRAPGLSLTCLCLTAGPGGPQNAGQPPLQPQYSSSTASRSLEAATATPVGRPSKVCILGSEPGEDSCMPVQGSSCLVSSAYTAVPASSKRQGRGCPAVTSRPACALKAMHCCLAVKPFQHAQAARTPCLQHWEHSVTCTVTLPSPASIFSILKLPHQVRLCQVKHLCTCRPALCSALGVQLCKEALRLPWRA